MKVLNAWAKEHQSIIIWDLSHAVGAVDIDLKATQTLAAVGCTYKYLNGGPGAPAFLYLHESLHTQVESPIKGWFGHAHPFDFLPISCSKRHCKIRCGNSNSTFTSNGNRYRLGLEASSKPLRLKSEASPLFSFSA